MANFAILRAKKIKTAGGVACSLRHSFREQETPNADPTLTLNNVIAGAQNSKSALAAFNERLPDKVRKNGVLCIEYLITTSPEAMAEMSRAEQSAYFNDSLKWLKERHGAENVICAGVHRDETTPHMFAYVVPIDPKGRLNCAHFLDGSKKLSAMQTDFYDQVAKNRGLHRGIEGSKAKHQTIQRFYSQLDSEARDAQKGLALLSHELKDQIEGHAKEKALEHGTAAFKAGFAEWQAEQLRIAELEALKQAEQRAEAEKSKKQIKSRDDYER